MKLVIDANNQNLSRIPIWRHAVQEVEEAEIEIELVRQEGPAAKPAVVESRHESVQTKSELGTFF
jgi:hypothetical protein